MLKEVPDLLVKVYYMTDLGSVLTLICMTLSVYIAWSFVNSRVPSYCLFRIFHILYEAIYVANIMITATYWVFLHRKAMKMFEDRTEYFRWLV